MLVLSRKNGESIMIGDQIEVIVLGVESDTVRLGIRAPKDIQIYRKELYEAIRAAGSEATFRAPSPERVAELLRIDAEPAESDQKGKK